MIISAIESNTRNSIKMIIFKKSLKIIVSIINNDYYQQFNTSSLVNWILYKDTKCSDIDAKIFLLYKYFILYLGYSTKMQMYLATCSK